MAINFLHGVVLLLSLWSNVKLASGIPDGLVEMECHDRYFMIAVDLVLAGGEPQFEAVDRAGIYPITEQYAARCGYSVIVYPDHVELRASYFSCHTDKDDDVFMFSFNLRLINDDAKSSYALNKTCTPTMPLSPREVACEVNYMEVSLTSEVACSSKTKSVDWNNLKLAHSSTTSDWHVIFHKAGETLSSSNLTEARGQGYMFDLSSDRLVFRTPYGQPDSISTMVNGVPVEVVHASLFSRQNWVVLMVDLVAACSMDAGSYDESGYMVFETPEVLYPGLESTKVQIGLDGELVEQTVAEERGYIMETLNNAIQIRVPFITEGYRKSSVTDALYEFYTVGLYFEQVLADEDGTKTRLRFHRILKTPLIPYEITNLDQTLPVDEVFTDCLHNVPTDMELIAVNINGQDLELPLSNQTDYTISKILQPINTYNYYLQLPFRDPIVVQQYSKENSAMVYSLNINYTLLVLPEKKLYYHFTTVTALTPVSPPAFDAVCSASGIDFKLDYQPFDYMWYFSIGSEPLTSDLASQYGFILTNDSQSLQLYVPLSAPGYVYKDISLEGFSGVFEILVRNQETSEVQTSTVKTCRFSTPEMIVCSTDGRMTVVADLSLVIPTGGTATRTNLRDRLCGPKKTNGTRALFSFPQNICGSIVMLGKETVTYQNEISYSRRLNTPFHNAKERVVIRCTYALAGLNRLFLTYRFESDSVGVGKIIHTTQQTEPATTTRPIVKPTSAKCDPQLRSKRNAAKILKEF